ncbi:MAG: DUF1761 domain-containing protein [Pseudomonadota bacterium]
MPHFNILAVLTASVSSFLLGGVWYSRMLFGAAWQRAAGDTGKPGEGHPVKVFGFSFAFALVAALAYSILMPAASSAVAAILQGVLVGAGFVAASFGINYQFASRSTMMWLIDGGYHTVQFGIYGFVIGLWR